METRRTLFFAVFLAYFLLAAGYVDTIDASASIESAKALVERGSFAVIDKGATPFLYYVKDGKAYSKLGLTHTLLYLLPVLLGKWFSPWLVNETVAIAFFVSLVNPIITALIVALLFTFFRNQNQSTKVSLTLSLFAGFATLLFPYSKTCHREPLHALLLVGIYQITSRPTSPKMRELIICGFVFMAAILSKVTLMVPLFAVLIWVWRRYRTLGKQWYLTIVSFIVVTFAGLVGFWKGVVNAETWTGYSARVNWWDRSTAWNYPFWRGIWEQWFAEEAGLFWYSPLLIVVPVVAVIKVMNRKWSWLESSLVLAILGQTVVHASWFSPTGSGPLGPRYLVAVIPLMVMLLHGIDWELIFKWPQRLPLVLLCLMGILAQSLYVFVKPNQYASLKYEVQKKGIKRDYEPQWRLGWKFFIHKLSGKEERYPDYFMGKAIHSEEETNGVVDLRSYRTLQGFNFWWVHLRRYR